MFLINYDFYDLHALIVYFRYAPTRFSDYTVPVRQIIDYMNTPIITNVINDNQIRRLISPYYDEQDESLSWVLVNNRYTANMWVVKKEPYYPILSAVFEEMLDIYSDEQRLYLLCDAAHNIPLILADAKKPIPIIKTMIKDYRKQYDKSFLANELKQC